MTTTETPAPPAPPGEERPPGFPTLSPSRAADFKTCPLLFRFRTIDRLPEKPTPDQVRGTLVHAVLESLFDLPAAERTPAAAAALVAPSWARLLEQEPALETLFSEVVSPRSAAGAVGARAVENGAVGGAAAVPAAVGSDSGAEGAVSATAEGALSAAA